MRTPILSTLFALSFGLLPFAAHAAPAFMPLVAHLEEDGVPVDEEVVVNVFLGDANDNTSTQVFAGPVDVIDGLLVVDVPVDDFPMTSDAPHFTVVVDGETLEGDIPVGAVPYAAHASRAGAVAWQDVENVPPGLLDGDDVMQAGDGLVEENGALALATDGVTSAHLADGSVSSATLSDDAVQQRHLANGSVGGDQLAPGAVQAAHLGNASVNHLKLSDDAVRANHLANGAVANAHIENGAINNAKLADDAVNNAKIADDAIDNAKIADDAVDTDQLADFAVTHTKIGISAVDSDNIKNGSVTTTDIASDTITHSDIAADAVRGSELAPNAVSNAHLNLSTSTSGSNHSSLSGGDTEVCRGTVTAQFCALAESKCTGSGCLCSVKKVASGWKMCATGAFATTASCRMNCF